MTFADINQPLVNQEIAKNCAKKEDEKQIIACLDNNLASQDVLKYACYLAKNNNWELVIVAVNEGSHRNFLFGSNALGAQKRQFLEKHVFRLIAEICTSQAIEPKISIREGEVFAEIAAEIKNYPNCKMLVLGKANSAQSDNTVLPRIIGKLGSKFNVPMLIIPQGSF